MDGAAVNRSFINKFNDSLRVNETLPLTDIGTCTLQPVHTAFTKGLLKLDFEQLYNDIFFWFKLSAARREDYAEILYAELLEEASQFFTRPVASHWLSLGAVCQRLTGQYPAMSKYFLKTLTTGSNKTTCAGDRYNCGG